MNPDKIARCIPWMLLLAATTSTNALALDNFRKIGRFAHTAWTEKEGAPQRVVAITQTADGYLWLGTDEGVVRFDGITFEHYQPQSGPALPVHTAQTLLALPNGDLWIGFLSGEISLLRNGKVENYGIRDGIPKVVVLSLAQDGDGTIWAGTGSGLLRLEGKQWKQIESAWNFPGKIIVNLFVDRKGTLWVAADFRSLFFLPRGTRCFQTASIRVGNVSRIVEAPNGKIWMAETTRSVRPIPLGEGLKMRSSLS